MNIFDFYRNLDAIERCIGHANRARTPGDEARACQIVGGAMVWVIVRDDSIDIQLEPATAVQLESDVFGDGHVHVSVGPECPAVGGEG